MFSIKAVHKLTFLAWAPCILATDLSNLAMSIVVFTQCWYDRSWGAFHLCAISFLAAVRPTRSQRWCIKERSKSVRSLSKRRVGTQGMVHPSALDNLSDTMLQKLFTPGQSHTMCMKVPVVPKEHRWQLGEELRCIKNSLSSHKVDSIFIFL